MANCRLPVDELLEPWTTSPSSWKLKSVLPLVNENVPSKANPLATICAIMFGSMSCGSAASPSKVSPSACPRITNRPSPPSGSLISTT